MPRNRAKVEFGSFMQRESIFRYNTAKYSESKPQVLKFFRREYEARDGLWA